MNLQLRDLRVKYEGKRAVESDRRVLSKAQVITGAEVMALRETMEKKEIAKLLKAESSKTKSSAKPSTLGSIRV